MKRGRPSKLTTEQWEEAAHWRATGWSLTALGAAFGVTPQTIGARLKPRREAAGGSARPRREAASHVGETRWQLTVIADAAPQHRKARVVCRCTCGQVIEVYYANLRQGRVKSCGCAREELKIPPAQVADLRARRASGETLRALGQRFGYSAEGVRQLLTRTGGDPKPPGQASVIGRQVGRLTVLTEGRGQDGQRRVLCRCFCGEEKVLNWNSLTASRTASCGCTRQHQKVLDQAAWLTYRGRTKPLQCWARELGLKPVTIKARLRYGWSVEDALSTGIYGRYGGAESAPGVPNHKRRTNCRLTEWSAVGVVAEKLMGRGAREIAQDRGVSQGTVDSVWHGRSWRDLFEEEA